MEQSEQAEDASVEKKEEVKLESADEEVFTVPYRVAEMSLTIKHILDDVEESDLQDSPIPLPNVQGMLNKNCRGIKMTYKYTY